MRDKPEERELAAGGQPVQELVEYHEEERERRDEVWISRAASRRWPTGAGSTEPTLRRPMWFSHCFSS